MAKPRGTVARHVGFSPGITQFVCIESHEIAAWCPDDKAQEKPTQVHLIHRLKGLSMPMLMRFKSPDTLGFLIEELARYRRLVWPDAEPLDLSGEAVDE